MNTTSKSYNEICPICLDFMENNKKCQLPCNHSYCYTCLIQYYKSSLNRNINGECCFCKKKFVYEIPLIYYLLILFKFYIYLFIVGLLEYLIILYFSFCFVIHAVSMYNEIRFVNQSLSMACISLLHSTVYFVFSLNQIVVSNLVNNLFHNDHIYYIYKIPSYILLYLISISLVYTNLRLV